MILKTKIAFLFLFLFVINSSFSQRNEFLDKLKKCKHRKIENENMRAKLKRMDDCYTGMKIPDFKTLTISGDTIDTKKLKGKILVINIWSLWCGPCVAELPGLNDIVDKYKDKNIEFIALTHEKKESIDKFLNKEHRFLFKIVPDAKNIYYNQLDSFGFPRTMIIDQKGIIRKVFSGGVNSKQAPDIIKQKLIPLIEKLINNDG